MLTYKIPGCYIHLYYKQRGPFKTHYDAYLKAEEYTAANGEVFKGKPLAVSHLKCGRTNTPMESLAALQEIVVEKTPSFWHHEEDLQLAAREGRLVKENGVYRPAVLK